MKREFIVDRQGKSFVLYAGLLDEAHQKGLKAIRTRLVQAPAPENDQTAICLAEVEMEDGRSFSGIGDATPQNVGRNIAPHAIRMAETRAKARALRDAINVGTAALEELGEDDGEAPAAHFRRDLDQTAGAPRAVTPMPVRHAAPTPMPRPAGANGGSGAPSGDVATPAQVRAIYMIARDQHGMSDSDVDERAKTLYGAAPAELSKKQASNLITALKGAAEQAAS